jgi:hypothetical protein
VKSIEPVGRKGGGKSVDIPKEGVRDLGCCCFVKRRWYLAVLLSCRRVVLLLNNERMDASRTTLFVGEVGCLKKCKEV